MPENIANLKLYSNYDIVKGELGSYHIEPMVRFVESTYRIRPFLEPYILVWVSDYEFKKNNKRRKIMIIIERHWDEKKPTGGCGYIHKVKRECFSEDDKVLIDAFINAKPDIPGYDWYNVEYKYIKL